MYVIDLERWNSCRCLNSSTYYLLLLFCCLASYVHDVVIGKKCEFIPMPKWRVRYRLMSNRRSQFRDHTVDNFVSPFCVISSELTSRLCALLKVSVKKISVEFGTNFSFWMLTQVKKWVRFHTQEEKTKFYDTSWLRLINARCVVHKRISHRSRQNMLNCPRIIYGNWFLRQSKCVVKRFFSPFHSVCISSQLAFHCALSWEASERASNQLICNLSPALTYYADVNLYKMSPWIKVIGFFFSPCLFLRVFFTFHHFLVSLSFPS